MWILFLYFPTLLYARFLCLASFYLLIKSRICLQSEQGCILLGEFFGMENLTSLNWNGFGYDHSLFKTDQYFLWFLGAQCILLKQNPSLSLNHLIWFRNKTSMYLLSVMVCQAPGCNDDCNKVRGHFPLPSPGRGLSVLLSHTASLTLHVVRQDFCSWGTVGISEGMSWDRIILCQSKWILGQRSLLLEESLLCAVFYPGSPLGS